MKLYDIFYRGRSMDSNVPFPPRPTSDMVRIVNTNWERDVWTVAERIDQDALIRLMLDAKASPIDHTAIGSRYEIQFRQATNGRIASFMVKSEEGGIAWVPAGYPSSHNRQQLVGFWVSVNRPKLTKLEFVRLLTPERKSQ